MSGPMGSATPSAVRGAWRRGPRRSARSAVADRAVSFSPCWCRDHLGSGHPGQPVQLCPSLRPAKARVWAGHHRACLGGAVTDSRNVPSPSDFHSAAPGVRGGCRARRNGGGRVRASCCQSRLHPATGAAERLYAVATAGTWPAVALPVTQPAREMPGARTKRPWVADAAACIIRTGGLHCLGSGT